MSFATSYVSMVCGLGSFVRRHHRNRRPHSSGSLFWGSGFEPQIIMLHIGHVTCIIMSSWT